MKRLAIWLRALADKIDAPETGKRRESDLHTMLGAKSVEIDPSKFRAMLVTARPGFEHPERGEDVPRLRRKDGLWWCEAADTLGVGHTPVQAFDNWLEGAGI